MGDPLSARPVAPARVVFDTFRSATDPLLASWLSFRARILPAAAAPQIRSADGAPGTGVYGVWRLLATNNRELARGTVLHPSPDRAWADAEHLRERAADLSSITLRGDLSTRHGWALRLDGEPVLMCSRWYESPGEAAAAARATRTYLGGASITRAVNIGTRSGRRYRQTREPMDLLG
ncbi:hypothetical protein [uncultured Microbacterium sp.]|uniref:hypothetical protein n=1 Tax=uncultured Microbacterium sp. TaxID=191216 RepID=UPI0025E1858A|nr:hypothetical protein [uncultured Microbacterium sp.]